MNTRRTSCNGPNELSRQAARALDRSNTLAIIETDRYGRITYCNSRVELLLGHSKRKLIGQTIEILLPSGVREEHRDRFHRYVKQRVNAKAQKLAIVGRQRFFARQDDYGAAPSYSVITSSGESVPISLTIHELHSLDGRLTGFVGCMLDQREQERLRQKIRESMEFDELTGLLCWRGLCYRIKSMSNRADSRLTKFGIIYIDIDHFSEIEFRSKCLADNALIKASHWLLNMVRRLAPHSESLVSRHFNASEFLVVVPGLETDDLCNLANQIVLDFRNLNLGEFHAPYFSSVSVGVAETDTPHGFEFTVSAAARPGRLHQD